MTTTTGLFMLLAATLAYTVAGVPTGSPPFFLQPEYASGACTNPLVDFGSHTCPPAGNPSIVDLSNSTITTAAECAVACCASPKVPACNYAAFGGGKCFGGDYTKQDAGGCRKNGAFETFFCKGGNSKGCPSVAKSPSVAESPSEYASGAKPVPRTACTPSGGCCDFTGAWTNEPTSPPSQGHHFTQSNCTISFPWRGCSGAALGATASGDTLTVTCAGFYDGKLTAVLELGTPYDKLKWSNGAGWSRLSNGTKGDQA